MAIGHRRLSIIDLSDAASQPMDYANGRYWITYNGEIYNYSRCAMILPRWAIASAPNRTPKYCSPLIRMGGSRARPASRHVRLRLVGVRARSPSPRATASPSSRFTCSRPRRVRLGLGDQAICEPSGFRCAAKTRPRHDFLLPASWITPTKRCSKACGNSKAANVVRLDLRHGGPARRCRYGAGMAFSSRARSISANTKRSIAFGICLAHRCDSTCARTCPLGSCFPVGSTVRPSFA